MIKMNISKANRLNVNVSVEGEFLETKIARILTNNEPITDGAPLIYTPRSEGVNPSYDIRTDRWDVALTAMDKVSGSYIARRDNKAEMRVEKGDAEGKSLEGGEGKKDAS